MCIHTRRAAGKHKFAKFVRKSPPCKLGKSMFASAAALESVRTLMFCWTWHASQHPKWHTISHFPEYLETCLGRRTRPPCETKCRCETSGENGDGTPAPSAPLRTPSWYPGPSFLNCWWLKCHQKLHWGRRPGYQTTYNSRVRKEILGGSRGRGGHDYFWGITANQQPPWRLPFETFVGVRRQSQRVGIR